MLVEPSQTRLSTRQLTVAKLAGRGWTNTEIAATLAVSVNTVKTHLKEVFDRLGVTRRAELASLLA